MNNAEVLIKFKGDTSNVDRATKDITSSFGGLTKSITLGNIAARAVSKAMQVMSSNMGSAISRLDTFKQYPNVLKNFGVSTKAADASIKRIDKTVRGLPTSLDEAVAGVQDLFMVTNDLKKSEKLFRAVNDSAMVFANGSTEATKRFTYAFKQAMAQGKVSAQDFNQMNEAIPGLMTKVAQSMGKTQAELKAGLSDGSIAVEDFNNALLKLDSEGGAGMDSLQSTAKTATGGIATSMQNMKTAIVRGLANMVDQVNQSLKPFGGLSGVMASIGSVGEKVFSSLGKAIGFLIPKIVKIVKWIAKYKDIILVLVSPILAIIAAMKIYNTVMTIATAVQAAYNAVMLANPVVLIIMAIIAAITLLVAGFMYLWKHSEGFRNFWIGLWNGITSIVSTAINFIVGIFKAIIDFVKNNWKTLLLMLVNPFAGAFKLIYDHCEPFRNFINNFVNGIKNFFIGLKNGIANAVKGIINFIVSIPGKIKAIPGKIISFFKALPGKMLNIGLDIVKGIGKGITSGVTWIKNRIKEFVGNVKNFLKKLFKIGSPSRLMADEIGQWIPKGIAIGITANTSAIGNSMKQIKDEMLNTDFGLNSQIGGSSLGLHYTPNVVVNNNVSMEMDPLGQVVSNIKTFSGGARNDYNYGKGA